MVVVVAQEWEWMSLRPLNYTLKNDRDGNFFLITILKKIQKGLITFPPPPFLLACFQNQLIFSFGSYFRVFLLYFISLLVSCKLSVTIIFYNIPVLLVFSGCSLFKHPCSYNMEGVFSWIFSRVLIKCFLKLVYWLFLQGDSLVYKCFLSFLFCSLKYLVLFGTLKI
jgi:hypothetical protein